MVEILLLVDIHQLIATGERTLPGEIDSKNSRRRFQIRRSSAKATQEFERLNQFSSLAVHGCTIC